MFRRPNKPLLVLWAVLICVGIVELLPAASPVMIAVDGLHIWDKLPHFCVYLALSCLSVIGFRDWRRGTIEACRCSSLSCFSKAVNTFRRAAPWTSEM